VTPSLEVFTQHINDTRYHAQPQGHYESFFQRANHPSRPLAFWIRYTIFSPKARPDAAVGELWAIYFNGETGNHVVVKQVAPLSACTFNPSSFMVQIAQASLQQGQLQGTVSMGEASIAWDMTYQSEAAPLLFLPLRLYETRLPAAKSLVGAPLATYQGKLIVNGETIEIHQWAGSQNHNWGRKHTDRYAWGQVAGFDTHPASFLEAATAQLKLGPVWSPPLTLLVLRHAGKEWALNSLQQSWRASGSFDVGKWRFRSQNSAITIEGTISAPHAAFVGLRYNNPLGGVKDCLNTKLASCELGMTERDTNRQETLFTRQRAAFEILTDNHQHNISIRV
jgi:Tocopherol cyclase